MLLRFPKNDACPAQDSPLRNDPFPLLKERFRSEPVTRIFASLPWLAGLPKVCLWLGLMDLLFEDRLRRAARHKMLEGIDAEGRRAELERLASGFPGPAIVAPGRRLDLSKLFEDALDEIGGRSKNVPDLGGKSADRFIETAALLLRGIRFNPPV